MSQNYSKETPQKFLFDTIHSYLYTYKEFEYITINYNVGGTDNFVVNNEKTAESICFQMYNPDHTNSYRVLGVGSSNSEGTVAMFGKGTTPNYCNCTSSKNFDKLLVGYPYSAYNLAEFVIKRWNLPLENRKHFQTCVKIRNILKECKITINKTFNNILMG